MEKEWVTGMRYPIGTCFRIGPGLRDTVSTEYRGDVFQALEEFVIPENGEIRSSVLCFIKEGRHEYREPYHPINHGVNLTDILLSLGPESNEDAVLFLENMDKIREKANFVERIKSSSKLYPLAW